MTTDSGKAKPGDSDVEAELLQQFAGFLKASFIYPSNNERVIKIRSAYLATHALVRHKNKADFPIALDGDDYRVGAAHVANATPVTRWLRDVMIRTALGGVQIAIAVPTEGLAEFASKLRENFTKPSTNFAQLWKDEIPGVRPIELRFVGQHFDGGGDVVGSGIARGDGMTACGLGVIGSSPLCTSLTAWILETSGKRRCWSICIRNGKKPTLIIQRGR